MQSGAGQESVTLKGEDGVREVVEVALKWKVVSVAILLAVGDTACWGAWMAWQGLTWDLFDSPSPCVLYDQFGFPSLFVSNLSLQCLLYFHAQLLVLSITNSSLLVLISVSKRLRLGPTHHAQTCDNWGETSRFSLSFGVTFGKADIQLLYCIQTTEVITGRSKHVISTTSV